MLEKSIWPGFGKVKLRSVEFSFLLASRYCILAVSCHFPSDPSISFFVAVTEVERPDLSPDVVSRLAGPLACIAPQRRQEHRSVYGHLNEAINVRQIAG